MNVNKSLRRALDPIPLRLLATAERPRSLKQLAVERTSTWSASATVHHLPKPPTNPARSNALGARQSMLPARPPPEATLSPRVPPWCVGRRLSPLHYRAAASDRSVAPRSVSGARKAAHPTPPRPYPSLPTDTRRRALPSVTVGQVVRQADTPASARAPVSKRDATAAEPDALLRRQAEAEGAATPSVTARDSFSCDAYCGDRVASATVAEPATDPFQTTATELRRTIRLLAGRRFDPVVVAEISVRAAALRDPRVELTVERECCVQEVVDQARSATVGCAGFAAARDLLLDSLQLLLQTRISAKAGADSC